MQIEYSSVTHLAILCFRALINHKFKSISPSLNIFKTYFAFHLTRLIRSTTKPTKWAVRPAKTRIKPRHPPSLIRVFAVPWKSSGPYSEDVDAQADLSLRWAHISFCCFYHALAQVTVAIKLEGEIDRSFIMFDARQKWFNCFIIWRRCYSVDNVMS